MKDLVPFFSVVIPVYNRAGQMARVLASLCAQSFTDWEAIIVDDGSKDSDQLIACINNMRDGRFKYIYQDNTGGGGARNKGIENAQGKYIAFLDSDDEFLPAKLETIHEIISKSRAEYDFIATKFIVDRGDRTWIKPNRGPKKGERIDEYLACTPGWLQTSALIVEKNFAQQVKFSKSLPSSQDTDFAIRCFLNNGRFLFIDKPLSIMNDIYDPSRVSKQKNVRPLIQWVDSMESFGMSSKAVIGYKGWQCARIISDYSVRRALEFYIPALKFGCYDNRTSIRILAQILIRQESYQKLVDLVLRFLGKGSHERPDS